jgi:tetratricopeptide (TPR) repeat protein
VQTRPFHPGQALQEALALHRQGRLRDAEKIYARVLKATPGNFDALHLLGLVKAESRQFGEAYRLMSVALKINPGVPDVWSNFANVLHALKRDPEALDAIEKALALRPDDPGLLQQRGNALISLARPADALAAFDAALKAAPNQPDALNGRGLAFAALGRPADALTAFDKALALAPMRADVLYNRGNALLDLDRHAEAIEAYDRVLARAPNHVKAWANRGRALQSLNRPAEAVPCFEKALALNKDDADTHFNLALALLSVGDYARGFRDYEARWTRTGMAGLVRKPNKPLWLGEFPLGGRTILLQAEQGLGDTIQFARYVPLLARSGAKIVLEVQPELKALLASVAGVTSCHARGEALPSFDLYCPMGSLPLAFRTQPANVPDDLPYLSADPVRTEYWRDRVASLPGKRIAIAWAGHVHHANDCNRSIDLDRLAPLLTIDGVSFVSIQRELRDGDGESLSRYSNVTHVGAELSDMRETAALLSCVDLTISVDTSVVHLAGALGREAWVMLPFAADWRWGVTGERSAWYPQLRLFRQSAHGDWAGVVARLRDALAEFVRA